VSESPRQLDVDRYVDVDVGSQVEGGREKSRRLKLYRTAGVNAVDSWVALSIVSCRRTLGAGLQKDTREFYYAKVFAVSGCVKARYLRSR
jgi:hypothetical protein